MRRATRPAMSSVISPDMSENDVTAFKSFNSIWFKNVG